MQSSNWKVLSGNGVYNAKNYGIYSISSNNNVFENNRACYNTDSSSPNFDFYCTGSSGLTFTSNTCDTKSGCTGLADCIPCLS